MDKLERALQKAREMRESEMKNLAVEQERIKTINAARAEAAPVSSRVSIDETQLESNRILAHRLRSQEADVFRILRTQLLQAMSQGGFKTIGITSANYGDGKTTVALNLAVSIAQDLNQTVLLVDVDLRKPSVTRYLGIEGVMGISDYFTSDVPIAQCLLRTSFERLTVLPAGKALDYSSEVLGSPKIAALADELKNRYPDRIIIYDMPPTLAQDDPIAFLPHVDATLLVVRDGVTNVSEIRRSMNVLAGAHVIGTVLNSPHSPKMPGKLETLPQALGEAITEAREKKLAGGDPLEGVTAELNALQMTGKLKKLFSGLKKDKK